MHSGYIIYFCDPIYLEEFWRELRDNVYKVPSQSSATQQVCDVSWSIRLNPDSPSRATRCPRHAHSFFLCIIQLRLFLPAGTTLSLATLASNTESPFHGIPFNETLPNSYKSQIPCSFLRVAFYIKIFQKMFLINLTHNSPGR